MSSDHRARPDNLSTDPVLSEAWKRIYRQDRNVLGVVCGGTGTRKSGSSITFCNNFDVGRAVAPNRFSLDRIVFTAQDFIRLVKSNLPKGSAIIWDEAGVDNDSREYYTKKNKLIKYVFQTFRYRNFLVLLTVPDLASIDVGTRKLMHVYFEMADTQPFRTCAISKVQWFQTSPKTGKIYFKTPRFWQDGIYRKLDPYYIPKPPVELEDPYKKKKDERARNWYKQYDQELDYMDELLKEQQNRGVAVNKRNLLTAEKLIEEDINQYLHPSRNRVVFELIQKDFIEKQINIPVYIIKQATRLVNLRLTKSEGAN